MTKIIVAVFTFFLAFIPIAETYAEPMNIYGTVVCIHPKTIYFSAGGGIDNMNVEVGDHVSAGDVLATIKTHKVYAPTAGIVYLCGEEGIPISEIVDMYGAVAYIDPANPYTITAVAANINGVKLQVFPGERVFLRCNKDGKHVGKGQITKIDKERYTVYVTEGEFVSNENVSIYRNEDYQQTSRIGRGNINKAGLTPLAGDGYLMKTYVSSGETVEKGVLLYETIEGSFAPGCTDMNQIKSDVSGIVASILLSDNEILTENIASTGSIDSLQNQRVEVAFAEIYPDENKRIVAYAPEGMVGYFGENDVVSISLNYAEDPTVQIYGLVEKISKIPVADSNSLDSVYAVTITITGQQELFYGMNVVVTATN